QDRGAVHLRERRRRDDDQPARLRRRRRRLRDSRHRGVLGRMRRQGPALLALFVALSGTAYATGFPANSIGPKQLQRNAVNRAKLGGSGVSGGKVANGSVTGADIAETTLGKVPASVGAESAENATSAVDAAAATSVPRADSASSADDSLRLAGGSPAS